MKRPATTAVLLLFILFWLVGAPSNSALGDEPAPGDDVAHALFIEVGGVVDNLMLQTMKRRIDSGLSRGPAPRYIVIELDTWGGYVDTAVDIAHYLDTLPGAEGTLPGGRTEVVCYIRKKAISAGALIALACQKIVMREASEIGDAAPVMQHPEEGMKMLGEKSQAPVRKKFKAYADKNGYPDALAMAMVSIDLEVLEVERKDGPPIYVLKADYEDSWTEAEKEKVVRTRVVVREGELATFTAPEAVEYGFCPYLAEDRSELLKKLALEDDLDRIVPIVSELTWWENFSYFMNSPAVQGLLMLLFMIGVGMDVYTGLGTGGIGLAVGLCALVISIGSGYMAGLTNVIDMVIIVVGLLLIATEVFVIPGFGVAGLLGIGCLLVGFVLSMQGFTIPETDWQVEQLFENLAAVMGGLGLGMAGLAVGVRYVPNVGPFKGLIHSGRQSKEEGYEAQSERERELLGKRGVTTSTLRPAGKMEVDDELYDVVAEGEYIDAGAEVIVCRVDSNRIVVQRVEPEDEA